MDCKRNRIVAISEYLSELGIIVNIGKTKARGNKGFFMHSRKCYRIDVAQNLTEQEKLAVILHEFAHYIHYKYDNSLQSLDFFCGLNSHKFDEELVNVTVKSIPKEFASNLFSQKELLKNNVNNLSNTIRSYYPKFKISERCKAIEDRIGLKYRYLLKYDRVNILGKVYSIDKLSMYSDLDECSVAYIKLKQQQRFIKRINSKISNLNKYYNNKSELFARFIEIYYTDKDSLKTIAPYTLKLMDNIIENDMIHEFNVLHNMLN